ncbi:MAG: hypothetical protein AVDCRST_MAG02-3521, partial [uncultured Rubrobacteraceae bacterium]
GPAPRQVRRLPGRFLGGAAPGLVRPEKFLCRARPRRRVRPGDHLRLDGPVPQPGAGRGVAGGLGPGVQHRPPLRALPRARRLPGPRSTPRLGPDRARAGRARRRPLPPRLSPPLPPPRLRGRHRDRALDPLRPLPCYPLRPLRRDDRRKVGPRHKLAPGRGGGPDPARRGVVDPAPPDGPVRGLRVADEPARKL